MAKSITDKLTDKLSKIKCKIAMPLEYLHASDKKTLRYLKLIVGRDLKG